MTFLPFFLARRLPLVNSVNSRRDTGITVAVTGIALSVIVMIVSISVMTGFRSEIRQKVIGFDSQLTVSKHVANLTDSSSVLISLEELAPLSGLFPDDVPFTPTVRQPAIMKSPDNFSGIVVKGIDGTFDGRFIESNMIEGSLPYFSADSTIYDVVISRLTASVLNLSLGDKVDTYFLADDIYKIRRLRIAGIFDTHFSEYDRNTAYASLSMLQQLAGVSAESATAIEINGFPDDESIDDAEGVIQNTMLEQLYAGATDEQYSIFNIHRTAGIFFNWLALLDTNVKVVISIMAILTLLTIISSLFIIILRNVNTIGVLKALGASSWLIREAFILMSVKVLVRGLIAGNIIALAIIMVQHYTGIVPLNPDAYYLDKVPVMIDWWAIMILNVLIIAVSWLLDTSPSPRDAHE
ncbi:MAG: ABC transporter permease, partial [Duncaniella sp.]|nr:ABC transporter permease [Duncaniella sp.]